MESLWFKAKTLYGSQHGTPLSIVLLVFYNHKPLSSLLKLICATIPRSKVICYMNHHSYTTQNPASILMWQYCCKLTMLLIDWIRPSYPSWDIRMQCLLATKCWLWLPSHKPNRLTIGHHVWANWVKVQNADYLDSKCPWMTIIFGCACQLFINLTISSPGSKSHLQRHHS